MAEMATRPTAGERRHRPAAQAAGGRITAAELIVSSILRYGVLVSLLLIAAGVLLMFARGETGYGENLDLPALLRFGAAGGDAWPRSVGGVLGGVLAGRPYAVILLGLLLLIATPVLRVAISVLIFLLERDFLYVAITLFVLGVLIASFLLGAARPS